MNPQCRTIVQRARNAFNSGKTKSVDFRRRQLLNLKRMYEENTTDLINVLAMDLQKSKQESITTEIEILINDLRNTLLNLDDWSSVNYPSKSIVNILDDVKVYNDPYGVVLVIGAWNYPLQLLLLPMAGAIAAGNTVIVKPSEVAAATSALIAKLIPKYLDNDCYQVMEGGVAETTELLKERFDYIFYTGSTAVGKIVQLAAAKHLTPVTLELGGKSPVYIDDSINVYVAVKRLLWGKFLNAGQTCIAPDYVLCTKQVQEKVVRMSKQILQEFYGDNIEQSKDYCRIVSDRQFDRITNLLTSGDIAIGGKTDKATKFIEPTILTNVKETDPIMTEEIFGPILPIVNISSLHDAVNFINQREKPLSLYIFSSNYKDVELLVNSTSSGGVCVNDTVMHFACEGVPFGGVGNSGMGRYHGKYSFDSFTHQKTCLVKGYNFIGETIASARYPPYSNLKITFLNNLLRKRSVPFSKYWRSLVILGVGVICGIYYKVALELAGLI